MSSPGGEVGAYILKISARVFLLIAFVLFIYFPGIDYPTLFDDVAIYRDGRLRDLQLNEWRRVLPTASFFAIQHLFGTELWVQRIGNICAHIVVCLCLWRLLVLTLIEAQAETTAKAETLTRKRRAVFIAVLFFATNPASVYAVEYLVQRSILFATALTMISWIFLIDAVRTKRVRSWLAVLITIALAVLCKEVALAGVSGHVLIHAYLRQLKFRVLAKNLIMVGALAAVAFATYVHFNVDGSGLMVPRDMTARAYFQQLNLIQPISIEQVHLLSALNQCLFYFRYGWLWMVPDISLMSVDLSFEFPISVWQWTTVGGALLFASVPLLGWRFLSSANELWRPLGLYILLPFVLFIPELLVLRLQDPFVIYRGYYWAIGICGILAFFLSEIKEELIYPVGAAMLLVTTLQAKDRVETFSGDLPLWSDAIAKMDLAAGPTDFGRWRAYINQGAYFLGKGDVRMAFYDFQMAGSLGAINGIADFNKGLTFQVLNQHVAALESFSEAAKKGFWDPMVHFRAGESHYALGEYSAAISKYNKLLSDNMDPELEAVLRLRRGEAALNAGDAAIAEKDFLLMMSFSPKDIRALNGLGMVYIAQHRMSEAADLFVRSNEVSENASAFLGQAIIAYERHNVTVASEFLDAAIGLEPENPSLLTYKQQLADARRSRVPKK